jgi:hypothetical protein
MRERVFLLIHLFATIAKLLLPRWCPFRHCRVAAAQASAIDFE